MKKRTTMTVLAALCVLVLTVGLMTGCGGKDKENIQETTPTTQESEGTVENTEETEAAGETEGAEDEAAENQDAIVEGAQSEEEAETEGTEAEGSESAEGTEAEGPRQKELRPKIRKTRKLK